MPNLYAHFQDLADALIGPFANMSLVGEHVHWCKTVRHDGARYFGVINGNSDIFRDFKSRGALIMTPEEDRNSVETLISAWIDKNPNATHEEYIAEINRCNNLAKAA